MHARLRAAVIALLAAIVAVALVSATSEGFEYATYTGTYVLKDGRAEDITIRIDHATADGWEGHAWIGCKGCETKAIATGGWTITIFALDRGFAPRAIATFSGTLSADGRTLSGPITKDGVSGIAILTAQ
jgi:hypothetical protein